MDETGISMSHKPGKVVAQKGVKTVQGKAGSRETITVIACVNPEGSSTPHISSLHAKPVDLYKDTT